MKMTVFFLFFFLLLLFFFFFFESTDSPSSHFELVMFSDIRVHTRQGNVREI